MLSDLANCHSQKQALVVRGAPGREICRSSSGRARVVAELRAARIKVALWSRTLCRRWRNSVGRVMDREESSEERVVVVEKEQEFASSTLASLFRVHLPLFSHRRPLGAKIGGERVLISHQASPTASAHMSRLMLSESHPRSAGSSEGSTDETFPIGSTPIETCAVP